MFIMPLDDAISIWGRVFADRQFDDPLAVVGHPMPETIRDAEFPEPFGELRMSDPIPVGVCDYGGSGSLLYSELIKNQALLDLPQSQGLDGGVVERDNSPYGTFIFIGLQRGPLVISRMLLDDIGVRPIPV